MVCSRALGVTASESHAVLAPALHARALPKPHSASALSGKKQATGRACQSASRRCPVVQLLPKANSNRVESLQVTGQDDFQAQDPRYQCCGVKEHLQKAVASSGHRSLPLPSSSSGTAGLLPYSLSGSCRLGGTKGNPL